MTKTYGNLIAGQWLFSDEHITIYDKYTREPYAKVTVADHEHITEAIANAHKTFQNNQLSVTQRYDILMKAVEIFKERKEEIALTICREAGKTITDSRAEVDRGILTFIASAEEAKQIKGEGLPIESVAGNEQKMSFTIKVPVGVICAITPFNFPFNLTAHKVAPAIAAGNTIVLKPAEKTPITAIKMAEILMEAGLPAGFLNVVNGEGKEVGPFLFKDKRISMYTFTGSPQVGEVVKKETGIRKVTLELGNNSPNIIHNDVKDLDRAIELAITRGFSNSGQACISVQRIYVHSEVYEYAIEKSVSLINTIKVGPPEKEDTDIGPLISEDEAIRAEGWIIEAAEQGAKIVTGGNRDGAFLYPTLLSNVKEEMKVMCEEVFAPIVSMVKYDDVETLFKTLNRSKYGLQVGMFTSDLHLALKAAKELEFGGVNINDVSTFRADILPYGGVKDSGLGKEGPRSAINEMTEEKTITFNL